MLTEEQIKNLKRGDEICIKVLFDSLCVDRIHFKIPDFPNDYFLPPSEPKHDPNRLFKKGDKVRVIEWNARRFHDFDHHTELKTGELCEVYEDEANDDEGFVSVIYQEQIRSIAPCFLEMVTPVEELEPYFVLDSPHTFNICKRGGSKFAATYYKDQPLAREHAEKYCAALNAAYRKEQQ